MGSGTTSTGAAAPDAGALANAAAASRHVDDAGSGDHGRAPGDLRGTHRDLLRATDELHRAASVRATSVRAASVRRAAAVCRAASIHHDAVLSAVCCSMRVGGTLWQQAASSTPQASKK